MGLTNLELKLFDSVEFCLALLGTIPVPIFLVDQKGKVALLNSGRLPDCARDMICAHLAEEANGQWVIPSKKHPDCIFCEAVAKVRKTGRKLALKGEWRTSVAGEEKSLIISINAAPATIKDETFVVLAIEDVTELERLKGLLPICMECNKIHDVQNKRWIRIDQYVTERSPAKFSHGLCPTCAERLLKEINK